MSAITRSSGIGLEDASGYGCARKGYCWFIQLGSLEMCPGTNFRVLMDTFRPFSACQTNKPTVSYQDLTS
jgi:hypothetical protein